MNKDKAYLWLSLGLIAAPKESAIVDYAGGILELYHNFEKLKLDNFFNRLKINEEKIDILMRFHNEDYLEHKLQSLDSRGIALVNIESNKYPTNLKNIEDPPKLIYAKGDITLLNRNCVAIVGTRNSSRYGQEVSKRLARDLTDCGIVVVSGLATGIDTYAHTATLDYSGKTIAVLAGGFDVISPSSNNNLAKQITANGLIISEYEPSVEARSFTFVRRNRIIAGISQGVIVVEAGLKSGALITANMTLEQGKQVFAVPGNITSPQSIGTNSLIKDGAVLITDGFAVANELGIAKKLKQNKEISSVALDIFEEKVYNILSKEKTNFDDIMSMLDCSTRELSITLSSMEIKKLIKKIPNNYYIIDN